MQVNRQDNNHSQDENFDPNRLKAQFQITNQELTEMRKFSLHAKENVPKFLDKFYQWLSPTKEAQTFFKDQQQVDVNKNQLKIHWDILWSANVNTSYINSRVMVGKIHAKINLPLLPFCCGIAFSIDWWTHFINGQIENKQQRDLVINGLRKFVIMDLSIILETYYKNSKKKIADILQDIKAIIAQVSSPSEAPPLKGKNILEQALQDIAEKLREIQLPDHSNVR